MRTAFYTLTLVIFVISTPVLSQSDEELEKLLKNESLNLEDKDALKAAVKEIIAEEKKKASEGPEEDKTTETISPPEPRVKKEYKSFKQIQFEKSQARKAKVQSEVEAANNARENFRGNVKNIDRIRGDLNEDKVRVSY